MSLAALKKQYQDVILDGMARSLWIMAYMQWVDEDGGTRECRHCGEGISYDSRNDLWLDGEGDQHCYGDEDGQLHDGARSRIIDGPPRPETGDDWDDVTPETPDAGHLAARVLAKLIKQSEGLTSDKTGLADLFEVAMTIASGEDWGFAPLKDDALPTTARRRSRDDVELETNGDVAYEFGGMLAMEALGTGVSWADDHRTKHKGGVFEPKLPRFEVTYDGKTMTWSGAAGDKHASGSQEAAWQFDGVVTYEKLGNIQLLNPIALHETKHLYLITLASSRFLVPEGDEGDALDYVIDWAAEHAPGLLADAEVDPDVAYAEAVEGYISGGNAGNYVNATEVHIQADVPRDDLYEIAGLHVNPASGNTPPPGNAPSRWSVPQNRIVCEKCGTRLQTTGRWVDGYEIWTDTNGGTRCGKRGSHVAINAVHVAGKRVRKNPDPGDEWGDGGAEAYERALIVRDAIDPKGPLALYEPEVFAAMSPEGRALMRKEGDEDDGKDDGTDLELRDAYLMRYGTFIKLHPAIGSKAMSPFSQAEFGRDHVGEILAQHVHTLLNNLLGHLNHRWPFPGSKWSIIDWGWGYLQLSNHDDDTASDVAYFVIGPAYRAGMIDPETL